MRQSLLSSFLPPRSGGSTRRSRGVGAGAAPPSSRFASHLPRSAEFILGPAFGRTRGLHGGGKRSAAFLTLALLALAGPAAAAGADQVFAERRALLAADTRCDLFPPALRQALEASTFQARTALLRSGWTAARADQLGSAAAAEVGARRCDDPVLARAASTAKAGFDGWTRVMSMRFPGAERGWLARRAPDPQGFFIRQDIALPRAATFGVRRDGTGGSLVLTVPLTPSEAAPSAARLSYRDISRAPRSAVDTPGRTAKGLAAAVASPATSKVILPRDRRLETGERNARAVVFTFPDAAMADLKRLDPRETIAITLDARTPVTLLVEVGDLAAAHAFLAAEAGS